MLIPNPNPPAYGEITIEISFMTLCPCSERKMPDFGKAVIKYTPNEHLLELFALEDFLWQYTDKKITQEEITYLLAKQVTKSEPFTFKVSCHFVEPDVTIEFTNNDFLG